MFFAYNQTFFQLPIFGLATPLVAWKKILIECAQARQDKCGLQILITIQVNYSKLQVHGQIRGV